MNLIALSVSFPEKNDPCNTIKKNDTPMIFNCRFILF